MRSVLLLSSVACFTCLAGAAAPAPTEDDLTNELSHGPLVRVDFATDGRFTGVVVIADIAASAERLWSVLLDYRAYKEFMPRVKDIGVSVRDGVTLVKWTIDTPLVSTGNVNAMTVDAPRRVLSARTVDGDMEGSTYEYRVVALGPNRCRLFHTAHHQNMAGLVRMIDDSQHNVSIAVAMGSTLSTVRALSARAESLERARAR